MYLNSCGFFKNFLNMNWIFPFSLILVGVWHIRRASVLKQREEAESGRGGPRIKPIVPALEKTTK